MNIKPQINTKFIAYIIMVLQTIYASWSWFFLFFATISLMGTRYGGLITGILFLSNAVIRMFGAGYFAILSEKYTELERFYYSLATRLTFMILLSLLPFAADNAIYLILWTVLSNILLVVDGYMIFHLKYYLSDANHISLMRYSTLGNIGSRGVIAVASIVVIWLGKNNWFGLTVVCYAITFLGLIASCVSILYVMQQKNIFIKKPDDTEQNTLNSNAQDTAVIGAFYLFLMNLCFGAGALLLTRSIFKYNLIFHDSLNVVTFFYVGFVAINVFATIFDKACNLFVTWKQVIAAYFVTAALAGIFFALRFKPELCCALAVIWGIVYGWSLTSFFPLVAELIRGKHQTKLYAKMDSASRLGFVLSQLVTGVFLDFSVDPLQLLQLYSLSAIAGLMASFVLLRKKLLGVMRYEHAIE